MNRQTVPDDAILEAVAEAHDSHESDLLGGGVPATQIHSHLEADLSSPQLRKRLRALAEADRLERVSGQDPETGQARWSYRPRSGESE